MARDNTPVLKRCRSLDLDPIYLGIDKKSKRTKIRGTKKWSADAGEAEGQVHLWRSGKAFP